MTKIQVNSQGKAFITTNGKALEVNKGIISDVASSAEMDANLTPENDGKMYHYTGTTTSKYVNGRYYKVDTGYVTPEIEFSGFTSYGFENSTVLDLDQNLYSGPYQSTNYHIDSSYAVAKIKVKNVSSLIVWFNSYSEGSFDYTIISNLDASTYPIDSSSTTMSTKGFQKNPRNGLNTNNWRKYTFTISDYNEHYVWIVYRKDASTHSNDDRGYFVIEKTQGLVYKEYVNPSGTVNITNTQLIDVKQYANAQVVDDDLIPGNIKKDVDILGVVGTLEAGGDGYNVNVYQILTSPDNITCTLNENASTTFSIMPSQYTTYWNSINGITSIRFDCSGGHWGVPSDSYAKWKPQGATNWTYLANHQVLQLTSNIDLEIRSGTCLSKGTLITMGDGTKRPIQDVVNGDFVLGYNGKIQRVHRTEHGNKIFNDNRDRWIFENGYEIITTHRHEFYNIENQKMMYLQDWNIGEHAYTETHEQVALLEHIHEEEPCQYFSIWCEDENYFADGLLAGNRFTPVINIETDKLKQAENNSSEMEKQE